MDAKQLPLYFDTEVVYTWTDLDWDEQHFLNYLIINDGRMIPPKIKSVRAAAKRLKKKGLVRESMLDRRYAELTDLGDTLATDYFAHLRNTGKMWTCSQLARSRGRGDTKE